MRVRAVGLGEGGIYEESEAGKYLRHGEFREFFIEMLGWDHASGKVSVEVANQSVEVERIAQKRGFQIFVHQTSRRLVQSRRYLRSIQREVAKHAHEHILIFTDEKPSVQVWEWVYRDGVNGKLRHREHPFFTNRIPAKLLDRLTMLMFHLEDEERITLFDVTGRVAGALDDKQDQDIFFRKPGMAEKSEKLAIAMRDGGEKEFQEFVTFHYRLASWYAKKKYGWMEGFAEDVAQIAAVGLVKAAKKYDLNQGTAFSTYAYVAIQNECQRLTTQLASIIKVGNGIFWKYYTYQKDIDQAEIELGKTWNGDQKKWELGNTHYGHPTKVMWPERVFNMRSLDDPHDEAWREALLIEPAETVFPCILDHFDDDELRELTLKSMEVLNEMEQLVIKHRFATDAEWMTLEQIGKQIGKTKERIRQIESKALSKMRKETLIRIGWNDNDISTFETRLMTTKSKVQIERSH